MRVILRANTRGRLLQIEQSIHVRRDCYGLRGEFLGGGRRGVGHGGHGAGHARTNDSLVFEGVDGSVGEFSNGAAAGAGDAVGGIAGAPVSVFHGLVLSFVHIFQGVAQGLSLADVGVGELLRDGADLGKIFEFERHIGGDAISDYFLFRIFPIVHGLNG